MFDFVNLLPLRRLFDQGRKLRLDESEAGGYAKHYAARLKKKPGRLMPGLLPLFMERGPPSGGTCGYSLTNHARLPTANGPLDNADGRLPFLFSVSSSTAWRICKIRTNSLYGGEESKNALRELVDAVIINPPENRVRNGN